jgi:hypothetical protein
MAKKIRIIKATLPSFWYAKHIGEVFEVSDVPYWSEFGIMVHHSDEKCRYGVSNGDFELVNEEADRMTNVKSLKEIVEQLRSCGYTCEAGPLENNADFQLLERIAGVSKYTLGGLIAQCETAMTRDEIVEKAKRDVAELADGKWTSDGSLLYIAPNRKGSYLQTIVNKEKRTVVALLIGKSSGKVHARGIAKCDPSDCFNVHIGKAIGLRRALGLEVPAEYLNAPQPTEVRVGDIVRLPNGNLYACRMNHDSLTGYPKHKLVDDSREEVAD